MIRTKEEFLNSIGTINRYSLLDRMRSDCSYVIDACGANPVAFKYLWAKTPEEQIAYMRYLWESFPDDEKPQWMKYSEIDEFERKLITENKRYKEMEK